MALFPKHTAPAEGLRVQGGCDTDLGSLGFAHRFSLVSAKLFMFRVGQS